MRVLVLSFVLVLSSFSPARAAEVTRWLVTPAKTSITFTATQMGKTFTGSFSEYTAHIYFDPARLEQSHVAVDIDVASLSTGNTDRDSAAMGAEWFDAGSFGAARFEADGFRHLKDNDYEATGTLRIRDVTVPLVLPFTLELEKVGGQARGKAHMTATITLDRAKWNLGTGEWADTSIIANDVTVHIDLEALEDLQETTQTP